MRPSESVGAAIALCLLASPFSAPSFAEEEMIIEEMVVTGSRITRVSGMDTPTPLTSIDSEEIAYSGSINLGDFLNELPALRSTFSLNNGSRFIGTTGLNLLDLRGMGVDRTLVLVDGQRHVGGFNGSSAVDINTIPQELVERVEIITGGASAIYGADAVTGVVNFVMKDDFDGLTIDAQTSHPDQSGGEQWDLGITWGTNFGGERGNVALAWEHSESKLLKGVERDWITDEWGSIPNPEDTGPEDGIADIIYARNTANNLLTPAGVIYGAHQVEDIFGAPPEFTPIIGLGSGPYTFGSGGALQPYDIGQTFFDPTGFADATAIGGDGARFASSTMMYPDIKRDNLYGRVRYEFNRHFRLTGEAKYTAARSESFDQPTFEFADGLFISADNAFIQPDLAAVLANEPNIGGFFLSRWHEDLGLRGEEHKRKTQRYVVSLDGDIGDEWSYSVAVNYGNYKNDATALNNRNNNKFLNAVDAVLDGGGQPVCRNPDAQADGCMPLNLLGEGLSSQAAIDYIMERGSTWQEDMKQTVLSGYVAGPVFALPAGQVQVVAGAEYRKEESSVEYSDIIKSGDTFFNALADTDAEYDVSEVFFEGSVPILAGVPAFESLIFDAAVRFSDYDTIGKTTTWKVGLDWQAVQDVRLRLTSSRAVRAPNIGELFDPQQENFFQVTDPCSDTVIPTAENAGLRESNCVALGKPAVYESINDAAFIGGTSGGNPELTEEEADSLTYGVIFTPRFAPSLSLSIDYWDIDFDDAIANLGAQDILDRCVDAPNIDNIFCPLITRDPDFDINADNGIAQSSLNISRFRAEGIDYELNYLWDISDVFKKSIGSLHFRFFGTHLLTLDSFDFADEPETETDLLGTLGDPENTFQFSTTYILNNFTFNWRWRFIDEMRLIDNEDEDEREDPFETNTQSYHSVQARYLFPSVLGGGLEIYGGINNLTDKAPQKYLTGTGGGSGIYDVLGRTYYAGLRYNLGGT